MLCVKFDIVVVTALCWPRSAAIFQDNLGGTLKRVQTINFAPVKLPLQVYQLLSQAGCLPAPPT